MKRRLTLGILAHVDAGKTTLSESMLYTSGKIASPGRVDHGDAYLDTHDLERLRGITIFSKQALFTVGEKDITLLDTPGHVDFSAEMERTLQVLDCAVLVVSGPDGVQGHTKTLWELLAHYGVPTFLFVNKTDLPGADRAQITEQLRKELSDSCLPFDRPLSPEVTEQMALSTDAAMEAYLTQGHLDIPQIRGLIAARRIFPVYFGSALRHEGVSLLLEGLAVYGPEPAYPEPFSARVYKISRDEQGARLTHLKVTGGTLRVKDVLSSADQEEKVNQIRLYSGDRFTAVPEAPAGTVCAVTGLTGTHAGQTFGLDAPSSAPVLESFLSYRILLPEGQDARAVLPKLRQLEEEDPALHLVWHEGLKEIHVQLMGEVQMEVLRGVIRDRFGIAVDFDAGSILYKETLAGPVEGVGHFEPLRHYAEVHLLLEPAPRGSGLQFATACSEDLLDRSWQRLILSHLQERPHPGVLTGAPVTDLKITLVSGRAHARHTSGGDFREATYRAVRHGLKCGDSLLLEPYYAYRLELPPPFVGKAMAAIDLMQGTCELAESSGEMALLTGTAPVSAMRGFHLEVAAFTKGHGRLTTALSGYDVCRDAEAVIQRIGYDSERDVDNPTGSIFCSTGSGFYVPWQAVADHMHLERFLKAPETERVPEEHRAPAAEPWISLEEIDSIINSTYFANRKQKVPRPACKSARESYYEGLSSSTPTPPRPTGEEYLLIDGYNVIHAWPELAALAQADLEAARLRLQDILCSYNGLRGIRIIVVFDAYKVPGRQAETEAYNNISLVFTAEAQTADQYIEKFTRQHQGRLQITVATSDGLQQLIIRGSGSRLMSARELYEEVVGLLNRMAEEHLSDGKASGLRLSDTLSEEQIERLNAAKKPRDS